MFSGQQSSRIGHTYKRDILLACKQNHVLLTDNSISNTGHIDNIGVSLSRNNKKSVDNNTIIWAYANDGEVKISNVKIESTSEAARRY